MKSDYEEYRDTGMLGGYHPENAVLRRSADGSVDTIFRDTECRIDGEKITMNREMYIGGKLFCISSIFPSEVRATPTDKLLSLIDADLSKEAHSA